jgi:hypothetical protein
MKMILDIPEERASFFMELVNSLDYISILKIVKDPAKGKQVVDLVESFRDVKLHEQGKKKLKTAKEFFNEL